VSAEQGSSDLQLSQQRYSPRIAVLEGAAQIEAVNDLAVAVFENGDVAKSVQLLAELVKQNPSSAEHDANLAIAVHATAGNSARLRTSFAEALRSAIPRAARSWLLNSAKGRARD